MATYNQCIRVGFRDAFTRTWTEETPKTYWGTCQPQSETTNASKSCCSGKQYFVQWLRMSVF